MNRVFVDMDGVIVDFEGYMRQYNLTGDQAKRRPGAYLEMGPIPGALKAVRSVIGMGYDVWIATKPPLEVPSAYSEKAFWIHQYLPEVRRRLIITPDKGLLGDEQDFLCDDRPHKANCCNFPGQVLCFTEGFHWPEALELLRSYRPNDR